jgi:hypothetical protein
LVAVAKGPGGGMSFLRKALYSAGALAAIVSLGIAVTVVGVEKYCVLQMPTPRVSSHFAIADEGYARSQGDTFLTFPEWYIVHAYNDLAGVTAQSSESGFDYLASVRGFWTSLCRATRQASASGSASVDQKATNYIIGFSFTAEMGLIGAYERTVGALTEWTTGGRKTAEDEFNLTLLKEYAAFLYQTPWFRFPFGAKLWRFWRETPFVPSIRGIERRVSLSLQYAARCAYAALIRFVAGYDPADLTIRSVVGGLVPSDFDAMTDVKVIGEIKDENGARGVLVETARYAAFDAFVRELGRHANASLLEVAGNHQILVTILAPAAHAKLAGTDEVELFRLPLQSSPGWRRIGIDMPVRSLVQSVKSFETAGYKFEHAYDY